MYRATQRHDDGVRSHATHTAAIALASAVLVAAGCAPAAQQRGATVARAQPTTSAPGGPSGGVTSSAPARGAGWAAVRGITGRWSGTWHAVEAPAATAGQAELVVLDRGLIRGTLRTGMRGVEGELIGQLRPQGNFTGACRVPSLGATLRLEGSVQFDPAGTAVASLRVKVGDEQVGTVDASLSRQ